MCIRKAPSLFDSGAAKKINQICLSDDSIRSRIDDMSLDVEEQVVKELKESIYPFSLQLDGSTDVANYVFHSMFIYKNEKHRQGFQIW